MLSNEMLQIIGMSGVTGIVLGAGTVFAFLRKKGIDPSKVLSTVEQGIEITEPAIGFAKTIAPLNPVVNVLDTIEKYAKTGVKNAEQLYLSSQLPADQRNVKAKDIISAVLKASNVEVTPEIEKIIDGAIEASVLDLGHNKTDAEKQAALQKLQTQVSQLTTENTNLRNAITTAASTVQISNQPVPNATQPVTPAAQ